MMINSEYIKTLKNRIYKILCLFEEKNEGLTQYIESLIYELYGLQYLIGDQKYQVIISITCILEHFYDDSFMTEYDIPTIRREVFHCLDLIEKSFKVGD